MSRDARLLPVLAAIALALGALVLWSGRRAARLDRSTLLPVSPSAISRVTIETAASGAREFVRNKDGWREVRPAAGPADATRLQVLAELAASPVARWIPAPEVNAAQAGLAPPVLTLDLDGTPLRYGGLSALGDLRYVRVGERVALVPRQYAPEAALLPHADAAR